MRSGGNVLLTAISMISSGLRPDRLAAAAICSRTRAMFSTIGIGRRTTQDTKYHDGEFCFGLGGIVAAELRSVWADECVRAYANYIMPTGGAGSLGSPALESGILIMMPARPAITISPTR